MKSACFSRREAPVGRVSDPHACLFFEIRGMRVGDPRHIPVRTLVVMAAVKVFPHDPDLFEQGLAC